MATYYPAAGTGTRNWHTASTWATSQGGVPQSSMPTVNDDVIIEGINGTHVYDIALDSATLDVCKTLTCQNVASSTNDPTLTFTNSDKCIVSGNITFGTGYIGLVASGGTLVWNAAGTLASNGVTIPCNFTTNVNSIYVFLGNAIVSGLFTVAFAGTFNWTTNETLTLNGGLTISSGMAGGTLKLIFASGVFQSTGTNVYCTCNIDLAGNISFGTIFAYNGYTKTITYVSGTITTTGSTLYLVNACTLNTPSASMHWNNINANQTFSLTLTSAITLNGVLSSSSGATLTLVTSDLTCSGIETKASGGIVGRTLNLAGGTWQSTGWTTAFVSSNINITGNCSIVGSVGFKTGTLTCNSALTITTTNSTLNILAACTLNIPTANMHLYNVIFSGTGYTVTNSSAPTIDNTLAISASGTIIFAGAYDISCANFYQSPTIANLIVKFLHARYLNISTSVNIAGNGNFTNTIQSDSAADTYFVFTGLISACKIFNTIFTYINATGSTANLDNWYGGILSNTTFITNRTSADIGGASLNVFGII